jgi:hypothetical protein
LNRQRRKKPATSAFLASKIKAGNWLQLQNQADNAARGLMP